MSVTIRTLTGETIHVSEAYSEGEALAQHRQGGVYRHVDPSDPQAEIVTEAYGLRMHWTWEPGIGPMISPGIGYS